MKLLLRRVSLLLAALVLTSVLQRPASALDWIYVTPNPSYSRDLAMGASTIALSYAPQSQSINPAGLTLFDPQKSFRTTMTVNVGGLWQTSRYWKDEAERRDDVERVGDQVRLLASASAVQSRILTLALLLSQPVMTEDQVSRYDNYEQGTALDYHQNSLEFALALHPRVSLGGRVDRYYRYDQPEGEGYSYGVILRPRGVRLGVEYQRYPASGARVWHPLDRRADQSTSAGIAVVREDLALSLQVMNLTESDERAFLEPHAGIEWRPIRALALRAGGVQFSRSTRWAWTAGIGLLDANWFHRPALRLLVPDDIVQAALGVIYDRRVPVQGIGSLTCIWRF